MGNRAIVIFSSGPESSGPAVYLHWNGGPESIYPMLDCLSDFEQRGNDDAYATARFVQIFGNFLGSSLSLGLFDAGPRAEWPSTHGSEDNGLYVIGWNGNKDYTVRRFVGRAWLTDDQVFEERQDAKLHAYNSRIDGEETIADIVRRTSAAFFRKDYDNLVHATLEKRKVKVT